MLRLPRGLDEFPRNKNHIGGIGYESAVYEDKKDSWHIRGT